MEEDFSRPVRRQFVLCDRKQHELLASKRITTTLMRAVSSTAVPYTVLLSISSLNFWKK